LFTLMNGGGLRCQPVQSSWNTTKGLRPTQGLTRSQPWWSNLVHRP
jgi:hypothetical protein